MPTKTSPKITVYDVINDYIKDSVHVLDTRGTLETAEAAAKRQWQDTSIRERTVRVGDGATVHGWSDSYACTIELISASGKQMVLREDKAKLLNGANSREADALQVYPGGFCAHVEGNQRYEYTRDPEGRTWKITLRKDGQWKQVGQHSGSVTLGTRHKHYDYNF